MCVCVRARAELEPDPSGRDPGLDAARPRSQKPDGQPLFGEFQPDANDDTRVSMMMKMKKKSGEIYKEGERESAGAGDAFEKRVVYMCAASHYCNVMQIPTVFFSILQ